MGSRDDALAVLSQLVLEDGRRWGDAATGWQWEDAAGVLDLSGPRRHFLTRPRGGSKTTDLGGVGVAALLEQLPARSRSYAFAADRDQAGLLLDAVAGFKARTPELGSALGVQATTVVSSRSGATLEIMASDDASAFGLLPHLTIVDEVAQWKSTAGPRRLWRAILSGLPKVSTSRLVLLTSAGDPAHWSHDVLVEARSMPGRWRVHEVAGPLDWIDGGDLEEQRRLLPEWEFARLHLNEWTASEDRLTTVEDLAACVVLDGPLVWRAGVDYVVAVDLGVKNDRTVAAVVHAEPGRAGSEHGLRVVLDRMQVWTPRPGVPVSLDEVEAWVAQSASSFAAPVVLDPWQATLLAERLRDRGLFVEEFAFTSQSVSRIALTLHLLIADHALALPDDDELLSELANVRLVEKSPGSYRLDHDPDKHDDRAIALALGAHWLLNAPPRSVVVTDEDLFDPEDIRARISPY